MERHLPVRTVYYRGREAVKVIAAGKPLNAVKNCVGYMRTNRYEATHAEVYSTDNGDLYGVIKRSVTGNCQIVYEGPMTKAELRELGL